MKTKQHLLSGLLVAIFALFVGCQNSKSNSDSKSPKAVIKIDESAKAKAVAVKEALFNKLSGRLTTVIQSDGAAKAIEVCSDEAPDIAREVGEEHGVLIGRTSFKLRNPKNAPPEWVEPLMDSESFEPQFTSLPNGHTGALLPIKLQAKCLLCHGPKTQIPPDVKEQLTKLYPLDKATGFKEGDLRGWFWVDVPAQDKAASTDAK